MITKFFKLGYAARKTCLDIIEQMADFLGREGGRSYKPAFSSTVFTTLEKTNHLRPK